MKTQSQESRGRADRYCISACMRKDDSGLEDELEYFWDAPIPSDSDEREEDRLWSPGPQGPSSEEDEEEVLYLVSLLGAEPKEDGNKEGVPPPQGGIAASPSGEDHQASVKEPVGGEEGPPRLPCDAESPATKRSRRRKLRKKETVNENKRWETARHDTWLRELLVPDPGGPSISGPI